MLDPDYLEWSPDGERLQYTFFEPRSPDLFDDQYDYRLERYQLQSSKRPDSEPRPSEGVKKYPKPFWRANVFNPIPCGKLATKQFFHSFSGSVKVQQTRVVKQRDELSGTWNTIENGHIYTTTEDGLVVREFSKTGVTYKYIDRNAAATQQFAFSSSWKMPFGGSAYLVQGGALFSSGACDGSVCQVVGHTAGALGYALDWQQTQEAGQGNWHVLAIEDGTVAALATGVTCNTGTSGCVDYVANCSNTNSGAGNYVVIAHGDGSFSFYAHMKNSIQFTLNQAVSQGDYLGEQGHSGVANSYAKYHGCSDHLHFQRQSSPALWNQSIPTDFKELPCSLSCGTAYVSENVENGASAVSALTVELVPTSVGGSSLTGGVTGTVGNRVILPAPAPAGGASVALSSSNTGVASVPASISVPAGKTYATFPVSTQTVLASTAVNIGGAYNGNHDSATLTVTAPGLVLLFLKVQTYPVD